MVIENSKLRMARQSVAGDLFRLLSPICDADEMMVRVAALGARMMQENTGAQVSAEERGYITDWASDLHDQITIFAMFLQGVLRVESIKDGKPILRFCTLEEEEQCFGLTERSNLAQGRELFAQHLEEIQPVAVAATGGTETPKQETPNAGV